VRVRRSFDEDVEAAERESVFSVPAASQESLRARVLECYKLANPEKVRSGEASRLLGKYRGQEALLLRRIQHKYGLEALRGKAWALMGETWETVSMRLTAADGALRYRTRDESFSLDAKCCLVEVPPSRDTTTTLGGGGKGSIAAAAAEGPPTSPLAAAAGLGASSSKVGLVVASVGASRLFRFASTAERDAWSLELRKTRAFFDRVENERRVKAANERNHELALAASRESAEEEASWRRHREKHLAVEMARAAALSQLDDDKPHHHHSLDALCASLEADVDEALVCVAQANDLAAKKNNDAAAFEAYLASVAAFVNVKVTVEQLPTDRRPESHVLALVDRGTTDCKNAAATLLEQRKRRAEPPPSPLDDDADASNATIETNDTPHTPVALPVPAAISKIIVDADDL